MAKKSRLGPGSYNPQNMRRQSCGMKMILPTMFGKAAGHPSYVYDGQ